MSTDAIVQLKADHKELRRLFREFGRAGDRAVKKKADLVGLHRRGLDAQDRRDELHHHQVRPCPDRG